MIRRGSHLHNSWNIFLLLCHLIITITFTCQQGTASSAYPEHERERERRDKKCVHSVDIESDSLRETAADIKKQLLHERTNYERLMLQVAVDICSVRVEYDGVEYHSIRNRNRNSRERI